MQKLLIPFSVLFLTFFILDCKDPPVIAEATTKTEYVDVSDTFKLATSVKYTCDTGFVIQPFTHDGYKVCSHDDATWSSEPFECVRC